MEYKTIATNGKNQFIIKKSKFICHLKRVTSEEEASTFIKQIKKEHPKATHNCSAFIIGKNRNNKRSNDDGEPSATAGVPMLTVLEKQQLTNVCAVVTRYFGGIKLGSGGLIRAYSTSVSEAIKAVGCVQVMKQQIFRLTIDYRQYQLLSTFLSSHGLQEKGANFGEAVDITLHINKEEVPSFLDDLRNYFNGKFNYSLQEEKLVDVPVI